MSSMSEEVVGIPLLAAAAMSAPPRRFALLMAHAALVPNGAVAERVLEVAKEWAAWLEEGEGQSSIDLPEEPFEMGVESRPGVQSFGRP